MNIYINLLIGFLSVCSTYVYSRTIDEFLLSTDSIKYWDKANPHIGTGGLAFRASDHRPFWYDENRYYSYASPQEIVFQKIYRVENNSIEIQLYYDTIPVGEKDIFQIMKLTEDSLILHKNGHVELYIKSKDQSTRLLLKPEQQRGYRFAQIKSQKQIEKLIGVAYKTVKTMKRTFPIEFQINVHIKLGKDGTVKTAIISESSPDISKYSSFYTILLSKLKEIKFIPAHNDYTGETYDCDLNLPIKYRLN